jgi:hypothetical protein
MAKEKRIDLSKWSRKFGSQPDPLGERRNFDDAVASTTDDTYEGNP